ncbi:MAG: hypothetical protein AAF702_29865 [Chloroflexota bacterium]
MPATLVDKVSMLVSSNLQSLVGQVYKTKNTTHFFRHYLQIEEQLGEVEQAIREADEEAKDLQQKGLRCSEQRANLDKMVDGFLVQRREKEAARAQKELNQLERLDDLYRQQAHQLDAKRAKLLKARDTLEVRLSLMKEEREKLEAFVAEYRAQQRGQTASDSEYRVVD